MHCKSLWIKASAKCINVNVNAALATNWKKSKTEIILKINRNNKNNNKRQYFTKKLLQMKLKNKKAQHVQFVYF